MRILQSSRIRLFGFKFSTLMVCMGLLAGMSVNLTGCALYDDDVRPPSDKEIQDARSIIKPKSALREGVFHMQRIQDGSMVRVKDEIHLKKPDLPPFDVAYIGRDLESVVLELANASGESVVIPQGLRGHTVTLVHSGANFQQMLELVLGKAGYHYNYVNGVWYITRFPVRTYILEVSQSNRKGSIISKAELNPELASGVTNNSTSSELDTDYTDTVWTQVRETLSELIKTGDSDATQTALKATGVGVNGELLTTNNVTAVNVGVNGLLPPPETTDKDKAKDGKTPDANLFNTVSASVVVGGQTVSMTTPTSTDHTTPEDNANPWFKITESAGIITVRASPEAHRQIEEYLEQVQEAAHRQVMVEARIVALIRDKTTERGGDINLPGNAVTGSALSRLGFFNDSRTALAAATSSVQGGFFTLASKSGDMGLVLQSLSTLGDVYTISSPSLMARNNQISRVAVTRQLGYAETEVNQNTTSTGDIVIGSRQDKALFKNSGTVMSVMPYIGKSSVQMRFRLSLATKAGETTIKTAVGNTTPVVNAVPELANNLIDQDMVLEYGRIYAIGGLIENNTTVTNTYEPMLRNIPGLGEIFQRATNRGLNTEFLVLLKISRS
jgi:type II secretory pathway component GspD/PulD (secretin)